MSFRRWSWTLVLAVSLLVAGFGGSEDTIRFAVIGDYGVVRQSTEDVANLIKSWNPDFIITTGDNNYQEGAASTIDENIGQFFHSFIYPYKGIYGPGATNNRFFISDQSPYEYRSTISSALDSGSMVFFTMTPQFSQPQIPPAPSVEPMEA